VQQVQQVQIQQFPAQQVQRVQRVQMVAAQTFMITKLKPPQQQVTLAIHI
jgi:hypothetical protein